MKKWGILRAKVKAARQIAELQRAVVTGAIWTPGLGGREFYALAPTREGSGVYPAGLPLSRR